MNTPAHLIFGLAAFGKPGNRRVTEAALVGALIPDLSLYLMAGWHLQVLGTSPQIVFDQLYFSDAWQSIFRIDNSFILWGIAIICALWARSGWAFALCGAALLHLALDFPLHHDDGRAHFWPITTWIFESPISYWDRDHYGQIVSIIETALVFGVCIWLVRRFRTWPIRALICVLGAMQIVPSVAFAIMMAPQ